MGQAEIFEYLEKQQEPTSRGEIALALKESPSKVSTRIAKLLKHEEIKCIEIDRKEAHKRYGTCRRMFIYYL